MTLTLGRAPLGTDPAPTNFTIDGPRHRILVEPHPKRFRLEVAGEVVVDTTDALFLHESNMLPRYYVPAADVRTDVLRRTDTTTHCPFKGEATYWAVRIGDHEESDLAWSYEEPLAEVGAIAGHLSFDLDRVDRVLEEDVELVGHPRDPYHRVDTMPSSRHVVVRVGDRVVAETTRPMVVFETQMPLRFYVPGADVTAELVPSDTTTVCPYKGVASYASLADGPSDVAWGYPDPFPEGRGLDGHWSFAGDDVTIEVDGEVVPA